jgi:hypothetical protein
LGSIEKRRKKVESELELALILNNRKAIEFKNIFFSLFRLAFTEKQREQHQALQANKTLLIRDKKVFFALSSPLCSGWYRFANKEIYHNRFSFV